MNAYLYFAMQPKKSVSMALTELSRHLGAGHDVSL